MNGLLMALSQDLWRATWQAGAFVIVVYAICKLFKGLPAPARHWLWWLACLQFPLRLLFLSPVALPVLPSASRGSATVELPGSQPERLPSVQASPANPARTNESGGGSVSEPASPIRSAAAEPRLTPTPANSPSEGGDAIQTREFSASSAYGSGDQPEPISPAQILLFGWGVGVVTVLVLASRRLIRTGKLLAQSWPVPGDAERVTLELSAQLGVRPPRIRESESAPCPLLAGLFHPTIVLPAGFVIERNAADLRMAIAHELVHLKRRDLWLSGVPLLTQSLFFFHPFAWLAIRESAAACEEACDVEAMRLSGSSPSAYARLLLSSAQPDVPIAAMGAAFGFRLLQRRINMLSQSTLLAKSHVRRGVTALIALGIVCSIPWTVTAQTPAKPAAAPKPPKKATVAHKRHATRHHAAKKPTKARTYTVISKNGKTITVTAAGTYPSNVAPPNLVPPPPAIGVMPPRSVTVPAPGFTIVARGSTRSSVPMPPPAYGVATGAAPTARITPPAPGSTTPTTAFTTAPPPPVGRTPSPVNIPPAAALPSPMAATISSEPMAEKLGPRRVSIDMHQVDIVTALRTMFKSLGIDYSIKSTVDHDVITCTLKDVSIDVALHTILESAKQELTFRVEDGVYMIMPRGPQRAGDK